MSDPMHDIVRFPRVSIVIPSADGYRDGCVPRLLDSINEQTYCDHEVILITGVRPQGKAINQGAAKAKGQILVILDDDSELADKETLERLVDALDRDSQIGMAGASILLSPKASTFQRRAATQFPRLSTPSVETITDSDMACHGCCAFPKNVFDAIGGEREDILRGLDPDLRERIRVAGHRVVLVPGAHIYHPLPSSLRNLVRVFFRNGVGSAYAMKFQPDSVRETHEAVDASTFTPIRSMPYRVIRFPLRLLKALLTGRLLRFTGYTSYAIGYLWGWLTAREM